MAIYLPFLDKSHLAIVQAPPLITNYNHRIRPVLDAIDKLRHLQITKEGIKLPTIVVVGDQSSGKSSVLESLAGISLPRGQGICTRVPLIMSLQQHSTPDAKFTLMYNEITVETDENHISEAISNSVPDLTMIDLPGITRVPLPGQPQNISEQISNIIMKYITPKEHIILNVISATVDFSTCESIRMSHQVDVEGERTFAVVTKVDKSPEGLLEKVTSNDVKIGLGYVCVRNRVGNESYEEARVEEERLFVEHPLLCKIDKSIVGIPVLAQKLVEIQAKGIAKCLPEIKRSIKEKLRLNVAALNSLPQNLSTSADVMKAFYRIISCAKESLTKVLLRGEFDEYPDEVEMHCKARMAEMLNEYSALLQAGSDGPTPGEKFLAEEVKVLEECKVIELPGFLPKYAFQRILQTKVTEISDSPIEFVEKVWSYVEKVVARVVAFHSEAYPQLENATTRAVQTLLQKVQDKSFERVKEMIEMEKFADYTCHPEYQSKLSTLIAQQSNFKSSVLMENPYFTIAEYGRIDIGHLRPYTVVVEQAFDIKMRLIAYWKIVLKRLVDNLALHLLHYVRNLVVNEMEEEIVNEVMAPGEGSLEKLLEQSPAVVVKRYELQKSIQLLKESDAIVSKISDRIVA
ncbi:dynamin GTPase [Ranunculus cassubicifolius]